MLISLSKLLRRGVASLAFWYGHEVVNGDVHQNNQSLMVWLSLNVAKCLAELSARPGQAEFAEQAIGDGFCPFVEPLLERDALILGLDKYFLGFLLAQSFLIA